MANNEQPYDPYIPSGRGTPGPNAQHGDNDRTAALQAVRQMPTLVECRRKVASIR